MCTDAQCLCAISRRWQLGSSHGSCYLIATQGYSRSSTVLRERCMGRAAHKPGRATERARLTLDSGLASTKAHDRTTTQCRCSIERFFGASICFEYDAMRRPQRDTTDTVLIAADRVFTDCWSACARSKELKVGGMEPPHRGCCASVCTF